MPEAGYFRCPHCGQSGGITAQQAPAGSGSAPAPQTPAGPAPAPTEGQIAALAAWKATGAFLNPVAFKMAMAKGKEFGYRWKGLTGEQPFKPWLLAQADSVAVACLREAGVIQ